MKKETWYPIISRFLQISVFVAMFWAMAQFALTPARADGPVPLPGVPSWLSSVDGQRKEHAWGDMDGDGDLDAVLVQNGNTLVFINNGYDENGNLSLLSVSAVQQEHPEYTVWGGGADIALGDMDNDGDLDLVVGLTEFNIQTDVKVYLNEGFNADGNLVVSTVVLPNPDPTEDVALGDMNGDGKLDIAIVNGAHATKPGRADYIHLNTTPPGGAVQFTPVWTNSGVYSQTSNAAAWGDPDRDGDLDLAISGDYSFHLFENIAGTMSLTPALTLTQGNGEDSFFAMDWGDIDGDGFPELAVTSDVRDLKNRIFKLEKQDQTWQITTVWTSTDYSGGSAKFGDVDNDGDLDLAVDTANDTIRVYQNKAGVLDTSPTWKSDSGFNTSICSMG